MKINYFVFSYDIYYNNVEEEDYKNPYIEIDEDEFNRILNYYKDDNIPYSLEIFKTVNVENVDFENYYLKREHSRRIVVKKGVTFIYN